MNKISCEICSDLFPLVKDEIATEDSKKAVFDHIKTCSDCALLYNNEQIPKINDKNIIDKFKKRIALFCILIIIIGILFGISIASGEFMFYNIIIMPAVGAISYFIIREKSIFVVISVFVTVYLRFLYQNLLFETNEQLIHAFVSPLYWAFIYVFLTVVGISIAFLFNFGFRKEHHHEKNT